MGRKRGRVPNTLWRQFGNKAATLSKSIINLVPKHCNCHRKGNCLRCTFGDGEAPLSYLIKPTDSLEYRRLMSTWFLVISPDAPPLPPLLSFTRLWSQRQIVERAIQSCFSNPSNLICQGYSKFKLRSSIAKILTSSTWEMALDRVGDGIMSYLLMHTLIFMPIKGNAHQQVAGPLVTHLIARFPMPTPPHDFKPSIRARHRRKRKRGIGEISNSEEPAIKVPFEAGQQNGSKSVEYIGPDCPEESALISQNYSHEHVPAEKPTVKLEVNPEEQPIEKIKVNSGKRIRLSSWQRRKRRKILIQESCIQEPPGKHFNKEETIEETCQEGYVNNKSHGIVVPFSNKSNEFQDGGNLRSKQQMQLCPCCLVFQSLSRVSTDAKINRKFMLYNLKSSSSLFLGRHIIHSPKPGFSGTHDLLLHILGMSDTSTGELPDFCFHEQGLCSNGSSCLYHSLMELLRVFCDNAKECEHYHLLKKHCSSQPLFEFDGNKAADSATKATKMDSSSKQDLTRKDYEMLKRLTRTKTGICMRTTEVIQRQFGLSQPYCLKDEVVSFVWAVCRRIVPSDLLGNPSFRRTLRRNIARFIRLRRFENFSLRQCLHKLELSKFPLLSNMDPFDGFNALAFDSETSRIPSLLTNSSNIGHCTLNQVILERWIFWFFSHIVVPLLQAKFYITESEHGKQNLYYYRKNIWGKLSNRVTASLKDQSYRCLDIASVADILSKRSFGFSRVRLCPKENGARPIANLKAPSRFCIKRSFSRVQFFGKKRKRTMQSRYVSFFKSVNTVLRDLHVIFKDLKVKEPERWGSTVFSYNDIHIKLCSFLRHLKQGQPTLPKVYIVVSDVQKAFDTVNQDKLLSILNEIPMADSYSLQKTCEIFCRKKSLWTSENLRLMIQDNNSGCTELIPSVRQRIFHTIIANQEHSTAVRGEKLKFNLKEHLKNNVLKLGRRFFLQTVGIPQGSVLSTLLCTLYYGHMERNIIYPFLERSAHIMLNEDGSGCLVPEASDASTASPNYTLLRFVDDFLFISTSKVQATSFFSKLQRGFQEYNCYMNEDKFCTNFDSGSTCKLDSKRFLVGSDGVSFMQWSGLLINSCSLEVQADYSRYLNDHLSSTLTVNWQHRPGRQLKAKLRAFMRPKCHPIFFDISINSLATIRLNVYQAFVLCAMKFHCYVRELSFWCKLSAGSCLSSIQGSLRYMYKLMNRRMHKVDCLSDSHNVLQVTKREVTWLGLTAYIQVLSKKKSQHRKLLPLLRAKVAILKSVGYNSLLKYAIDDSHSSFLWKIKY